MYSSFSLGSLEAARDFWPFVQLVTSVSPGQQIAKDVAWLKQNFAEALHGDELADRAHMRPSTFRQHFRALAGVSPLQYQKQLRLQEARQLMLNENLDAGIAGGRLGYERCWMLESLVEGKVQNQIIVLEPEKSQARLALDRMLGV